MATATSRKAAPNKAALARRRATAKKLLDLHLGLSDEFRQMAEIETELKETATAAGDSFKEQFGADSVSVAPGHAKEFKGDVPVVQTEAWLALKPAARTKLVAVGLIKVEPQWGKASSGRVTVKVP